MTYLVDAGQLVSVLALSPQHAAGMARLATGHAGAIEVYDQAGEELLATCYPPACRVCGCTTEQACAGGCIWIEEDLCSRCAA